MSLRPALLLSPLVLLLACGDGDRLHNICTSHPTLCQDLVDDGWCRQERSTVIRARYALQQKKGEWEQYQLMHELEGYLRCIEHATRIEYKVAKEKKSARVEGMLAAGAELERLDAQTRGSNNPWLQLWHWTNNGDEEARSRFLAHEGSPQLEHPELQAALAGIYARVDPPKAIGLLQHALSLYQPDDPVNVQLFASLSTLYMGQRDYKQAYLWARVSEAFHGPQLDAGRLNRYAALSQAQQERLDEQAKEIATALRAGHYRPE